MSNSWSDPPEPAVRGIGIADKKTKHAPTVRVVDKRHWANKADTDAVQSDNKHAGLKPTYVNELEQQLAEKKSRLEELAEDYKRRTKEFEETRDRLRRETVLASERQKRSVLSAFLEIADNLERAIDAEALSSVGTNTSSSLLNGLRLINQQCQATLGKFGVTRIKADNQPFDPLLHDALSTVPVTNPAQHELVIEVEKPGYMAGKDVLRPASVTVGKLQQ